MSVDVIDYVWAAAPIPSIFGRSLNKL